MPDNQTVDDMNASEAKAKRDAMVRESGLSGREWYRKVYLYSDHWSELRSARLFVAGFQCEKCQRTGTLDVHHLRYRSIFNVTVDDLQALCRSCHNAEHEDKKDIRRRNRKPRSTSVKAPKSPKRSKKKNKKAKSEPSPSHLSERMRSLMQRYHSVKASTQGCNEIKILTAINSVEVDFHLLTNPDADEKSWMRNMMDSKTMMTKRLQKRNKPK